MQQVALEVFPARRARAASLIAAACILLGGASLAYLWPVITARSATPSRELVQVGAAEFDSAASGWVVAGAAAAGAPELCHPAALFRSPGRPSAAAQGRGCRPAGLFRTADGGSTWTSLALPVEEHAAAGVATFLV